MIHYIPTINFYTSLKKTYNDNYSLSEPLGEVFWQDIDNLHWEVVAK